MPDMKRRSLNAEEIREYLNDLNYQLDLGLPMPLGVVKRLEGASKRYNETFAAHNDVFIGTGKET